MGSGNQLRPNEIAKAGRHPVALWGVLGILGVLTQAIVRLGSRALDPFERGLLPWQWGLYALCVVYFTYSEGVLGFQRAYSPRVVVRAFHLGATPRLLLGVLAPPVCMGLLHATRRRLAVSWSLLLMIIGLVMGVRYLPYPYREIVDAGVVAGLLYGAVTIIVFYIRGLRGSLPDTAADLPEG